MAPDTFVVVLTCGTALIVAWFVARFPETQPGGVVEALIHLSVAVILASVVSLLLAPAFILGGSPSLVLLLVPTLGYMMVASLWTIRTTVDAAARRGG